MARFNIKNTKGWYSPYGFKVRTVSKSEHDGENRFVGEENVCCPKCASFDVNVVPGEGSRFTPGGPRRMRCAKCGHTSRSVNTKVRKKVKRKVVKKVKIVNGRRYVPRKGKPLTAAEKRQVDRWVKQGRNPDTGQWPRRGKPSSGIEYRNGVRYVHGKRSPARKPKPRKKPSTKTWRKGTLHRLTNTPAGKKISTAALKRVARGTGVNAKRARKLLNVRGVKTGKRRK